MSRKLKREQKKYSRQYFMDNIIKPNSSWSKWTDMNTILRNQRIAIMIITVIIVMGIILSKTLNVSNTKNLFVGKNMWKSDLWGKLYLFIAIYGFVDAILVHLYWWCYQITWKKKKARDINTKSKKIIIRFIEVWNCPWIIFVNLLYMNLKKLNMEILVEYMSEIIFAISLTGTLSPLYVIIISFFMQKIPYSLSVKAEAKLLVFLSLICMGMVQKIVLKRELKKCTRKDVNYERIYWKIERCFFNIELLASWLLTFVLGLLTFKDKINEYIIDGLFYSFTLITAWRTLCDKIKE